MAARLWHDQGAISDGHVLTKGKLNFNVIIGWLFQYYYIKEGNENMKGGYVLVDCTGLDLLSETTQTISGLYNKVKAAMATGKMIIAENMIWGDDGYISPISVFGIDMGPSYGIYLTASTLQIRVSPANVVTIVNMAPST